MLKDFLLASTHHLLAFGLVAMLVTEAVLLARPLDAPAMKRLADADRGLGIVASLPLAVGLWCVYGGNKGADFYLHNPWFHAKLGAFLLAALISLWPTCASCANGRPILRSCPRRQKRRACAGSCASNWPWSR